MAVDRAGCRDEAISDDRLGVRAYGQVDAVADGGVATGPDTDDPAVLDADVGLHHAQGGVDDDGTDDDGVQLARPGLVGLRLAQPDGLAVAPQRLVAVRLAVVVDAQP